MFVKQNNQCEFAQNEWEGSNLWDLLNVLQIKNPFTELLRPATALDIAKWHVKGKLVPG